MEEDKAISRTSTINFSQVSTPSNNMSKEEVNPLSAIIF